MTIQVSQVIREIRYRNREACGMLGRAPILHPTPEAFSMRSVEVSYERVLRPGLLRTTDIVSLYQDCE